MLYRRRLAIRESNSFFGLAREPMTDDIHTEISSVDDILTFDEAMAEESYTPDFTKAMADKAKETGRITIYSSYPIRNGVLVTPSRMEAQGYAGSGKIYSKDVPVTDVAWIDGIEGQYAEYVQPKFQFGDVELGEKEKRELADIDKRISEVLLMEPSLQFDHGNFADYSADAEHSPADAGA